MIKFSATLLDDQSQILEWATADPYHSSTAVITGPGWWVTGSDALLAFCIEDDGGPVMYVRFDLEEPWVRMHTQFAPECQVTRDRTAKAILETLPALIEGAKRWGAKGFVFESTSPSLIKFMSKMGFKPSEKVNDYLLVFEEK